MPHNDYIKDLVLREIYSLKNTNNTKIEQRGINAEKAVCKIDCFVCMDTRKLWAWRRDVFSTSIFSNNKYDIIHCNGCKSGRDIRITSKPEGYEKDKKEGIGARINELMYIYNTKIKPQEDKEFAIRQRKEREEKQRIQREDAENERNEANPNSVWGPGRYSTKHQHATDKSFTADVKKIADIVFDAIKIYGGDFLAIANIAKNITLNLESSIHEVDETDEVIGESTSDKYGNKQYVVVKLSKKLKEVKKKFFGLVNAHNNSYTLSASYLLLTPLNSKARAECSSFISGEMTKFIEKMSS